MKTTILYGIPNCDATKKATAWLQKNNIAFSFHDYKLQGISKIKLEEWCKAKGWETIFNKRSTTWRELPETTQQNVIDQSTAIDVMMNNNSIIKRPIIEHGTAILVGYNETSYQTFFK